MTQPSSYTVCLPLAVKSSKKWFYVNLNNFRNLHPFLLNKSKIMYKGVIQRQLDLLPVFSKVRLTYVYYPRDNRKSDLGNVCSVHDKFFADAFVESGKLPDDNYDHIPEIFFRYGSIDKNNPRVEVLIEQLGEFPETQTEQDQMQITLDQTEIHDAIRQYVRGQINIADGHVIEIDMKAGRAENGFTATLDIRPASATSSQAAMAAAVQHTPVVQTQAQPQPVAKQGLNFGTRAAPVPPATGSATPAAISTGEERQDPNEVSIVGGVGGDPNDPMNLPVHEPDSSVGVEEVPMTSTRATGSNPFAGGDEDGPTEQVQEPEAETPAPAPAAAKPASIFNFGKKA